MREMAFSKDSESPESSFSFISEARLPRETKRHKSQQHSLTVDRWQRFAIGDGKFQIPTKWWVACAATQLRGALP